MIIFCKKNKYIICLCTSICLLYYSFLQALVPPQMGWWNYYGWQLSEGKVLYKDIYCYLPPLFVWIYEFLYKIFNNHLLLYQLLGVPLSLVVGTALYYVLCKVTKPIYSMLAALCAIVCQVGFLMLSPFDYNELIIFFLVVSFFFYSKSVCESKKIYILLAGSLMGVALLLKQTNILFFLISCLIYIYIGFLKKQSRVVVQRNIFIYTLSCVGVCFVGIFQMYANGILDDFISQMNIAKESKGFDIPIIYLPFYIAYRFLLNGFSFSECFIGWGVFYLLSGNEYVILGKYKVSEIVKICIYSLVIQKIYSLCNLQGYIISYRYIFVLYAIYLLMFLKKYKIKLFSMKTKINSNRFIDIGLVGLLLYMIVIMYCGFSLRREVYQFHDILFWLKRSVINVFFYISVAWCIYQIYSYLGNKKIDNNKLMFWVFIVNMVILNASGLLSTAYLEEILCIGSVAVSMVLFLERKSNWGKIACISTLIFMLGVTITQKEVKPYEWHGWSSVGLHNSDKQYIYSRIPGLEGYYLDYDTEIAYENIVDAINLYTTKDEVVYEFPFVTLFNVLTERELGTFAVSHYIDVCPDRILKQDLNTLSEKKPAMFIYDEFSDSEWDIHEKVFRNGKRAAGRDMVDFYKTVICNDYQLVYSYKKISVWVQKTDNEKNINYAMERLRNFAEVHKLVGIEKHLLEYDYALLSDIKNDRKIWSVDSCMAAIVYRDDELSDFFMRNEEFLGDDFVNDTEMRAMKE